jgi:dimethylhistidine N-methyltransferase
MKPAPTRDLPPTSHEEKAVFLAEVLHGLNQPAKTLPCKYFYDETGSRLFDAICELDEYYLTRTELAIMQRHAAEMADALGPDCLLIEFGTGSGVKTRLLLDHLKRPSGYVAVDLAREHVTNSCRHLAERYPGLEVVPLIADFSADFAPPALSRAEARRVVYFPGSTIGNFGPSEAAPLLSRVARLCGPGGAMLLGFDLKKDVKVLEPAYDDARGVTRDFNLNLLARINRELQGTFDLSAFRHVARYNRDLGCIEMLLVSTKAQTVEVKGHRFHFAPGESILTERSYKYDVEEFRRWVTRTGLQVEKVWTDERRYFAVLYLTVQ